MLTALPTHIVPLQLAKKRTRLTGCYTVSELTRAHDYLHDNQVGEIAFDWQFDLDTAGRTVIQGQLSGTLTLLCQRCLQPMAWQLNAQTRLVVFTLYRREEEDELPAGFEVLELLENPLTLRDVVEDEVILALPIVARHDVCPHNDYQLDAEEMEEAKTAATQPKNPFAVLQQLKKQK